MRKYIAKTFIYEVLHFTWTGEIPFNTVLHSTNYSYVWQCCIATPQCRYDACGCHPQLQHNPWCIQLNTRVAPIWNSEHVFLSLWNLNPKPIKWSFAFENTTLEQTCFAYTWVIYDRLFLWMPLNVLRNFSVPILLDLRACWSYQHLVIYPTVAKA